MRPAENIKRLIKNAKIKINPEVKKAALKELINELEKSKIAGLAGTKPNIWSTVVRGKAKSLAAAVIFIVAIIGLHQFRISIDGTSVAWGDVAERLEQMSSFTARSSRVLTEPGKDEPIFICDVLKYFSPDRGYMERQYIESKLGMLNYGLFQEKLLIIILPQTKQYYRLELNEEILSTMNYINPTNPNGMMKLFGSEKCTRLGSREINGVTTEGFEVKNIEALSWVPRFLFQLKNVDIRLWVNPETLLPIKVEAEALIGKGFLTGFKDFTGKEVVYDIEYDVEIDESIFEPNIPDDYILIDPANMAEKAELGMLGILPLGATVITYKHFKKKEIECF